jgi:hypothetical protein
MPEPPGGPARIPRRRLRSCMKARVNVHPPTTTQRGWRAGNATFQTMGLKLNPSFPVGPRSPLPPASQPPIHSRPMWQSTPCMHNTAHGPSLYHPAPHAEMRAHPAPTLQVATLAILAAADCRR